MTTGITIVPVTLSTEVRAADPSVLPGAGLGTWLHAARTLSLRYIDRADEASKLLERRPRY
jgi:hypothetical protein